MVYMWKLWVFTAKLLPDVEFFLKFFVEIKTRVVLIDKDASKFIVCL